MESTPQEGLNLKSVHISERTKFRNPEFDYGCCIDDPGQMMEQYGLVFLPFRSGERFYLVGHADMEPKAVVVCRPMSKDLICHSITQFKFTNLQFLVPVGKREL